ncbi:phosphonoacetate hydrolase [Sphingomonas nostoxanthinifaciens]|uniref:phosphonoacetate hydrolase n=1 Tax=Sphingomonas nostoxanthinifaciens TaxID=2872652 RepID=UPI001CC1DEA4|nr:phosphonoacetate hydrolase [Sphingomonas nostoxanthinifaciens]
MAAAASASVRAAMPAGQITVNGRSYKPPRRPTVAICVDGFDPAYLQQGLKDGILPNMAQFVRHGFAATARGVMPSFTNPNNTSILTGTVPAVHGISGNYYLDRRTGKEVMITDASALRCETILGRLSQAGVRVAGVTAKDKLREIIGYRMKDGIVFSSQKAKDATLANAGIDNVEALVGRKTPDQYDPDLSYFVLDAGARLIERRAADLLYLSLSDVIQHSYAPGEPEANAFMTEIDRRIGRLVELNAVVGVTGDHGMNDKSRPDGTPNVIWLEDVLNARFGAGAVRVICPITDPFVRHHGALGSFVRVYLRGDQSRIAAMMATTRALDGVELVLTGAEAARRFETPPEYEGDFTVVANTHVVIGSSAVLHDLSGLKGRRLRSHGGLSEQHMPFLLSEPLTPAYAAKARRTEVRNFDVYDYLLNGIAAA